MRLVAIMIALACHSAHAEEREPPQRPVVPSYRGSMLAVDGVALTVTALSATGGSSGEPLFLIGASLYVVGAPVMHISNERYGRAVASVAMRIGLPLLGGVIGDSLPHDCGPTGDCIEVPRPAVLVGIGVGVLAACAVDTIFLAKGDTPPSQPQAGWAPVATSTRGGLALGITGQF